MHDAMDITKKRTFNFSAMKRPVVQYVPDKGVEARSRKRKS
jgi:hypothetical protein